MKLRDYQERAVRGVYASLHRYDRSMLQLPTGSGKTHIAMRIIKDGLKHGKRVNFCVDRLTLLDQTVERFREHGIPIGVIQGQHVLFNPRNPVQIVSLQTLQRRDRSQWPHADLFIFDEAHTHYGIMSKVMDTWNGLKYIGLSATPFTTGLGRHWQDLVVGATTEELILQGYLSKYTAYGPSQPDLRGVRHSNGDWNTTDLEDRMNQLTGDLMAHFRKHAADKKTLVFAPTVSYAEMLAERFRSEGFTADYVCGYDTDERRIDVLNGYRSGEIQVLCNVEVLIKGYDQPDIQAGIVARPTRSLALHIQMLGRLLRTHPDKEQAIILDHAGNIGRHGFPDDPLPTQMCNRERGVSSQDRRDPEEPQPWTCPQCTLLVEPGNRECPGCGFQPRSPNEIEVVEGSLRKLAKHGAVERQEVYSQLLHIATERGYSHGWVAHTFKSIFGVWPSRMINRTAEPTPDLLNWITHRNIRHARRRRNAV